MSPHRFLFYAPEYAPGTSAVTIAGDEHTHLSRVLRVRVGDVCYVTDGQGTIVRVSVREIRRNETVADVETTVVTTTRPPRMDLAMAMIRRDRFAQAFEQCVELGITGCVPLVTERVRMKGSSATFVARLERVAVAAMKQSFRSWLPTVASPTLLHDLLIGAGSFDRIIAGHWEGGGIHGSGDTLVVVGPEADFSDAEREMLESAGAQLVAVSDGRLRAETAAVALVAAVTSAGLTALPRGL